MDGVFEKRTRSAEQDGGAYQAFADDGVLRGCTISSTADTVTIAKGVMMVCGRIINFDSAETVAVNNQIQNGFGQLKMVINLNEPASESNLNQLYFDWAFSSTESGFAVLQKDDINLGGKIYEYELGIATIQNLKVASFKRTAPIAAAPVHNSKIKAEDSRPGRIWILEH